MSTARPILVNACGAGAVVRVAGATALCKSLRSHRLQWTGLRSLLRGSSLRHSSLLPARGAALVSPKQQWKRPLSHSVITPVLSKVSAESQPPAEQPRAQEQAERGPLVVKPGVVPLLTFGADGKLTLDVDPDYGQLSKKTAPAAAPKTPAQSVPKWQGVPGTARREGPKPPSGAPKYSKAARRFYNETFRKAERLSKVLAAAGVASRRACEDIIFAGRVTVNGEVCKVPQTSVDLNKDNIYVDGRSLPKKAPPKLYFVVNKPKGYICSSVSSGGPKPALDLVGDYMKTWVTKNPGVPKPRLFTVGRLDVNTTGLLLITNDGDLAQKASHPSSGLTKEYLATVETKVTRRQMALLEEGVVVEGVHCRPVSVDVIPSDSGDNRQRIRIVVSEGRNHEVRNIISNAGLEVKTLKRIRIGGLRLERSLGIGKYTALAGAQLENFLFRKA